MKENDEEKSRSPTISQLITARRSFYEVDERIHKKEEDWRIRFKINNAQAIINP